MKKLENITKTNIFSVPNGYFERLPEIIQSRVAKPAPAKWVSLSLRLSLPVAAVLVVVFLRWSARQPSLEEQLNTIETEQLLAYIDSHELMWDGLEEHEWTEEDLSALEESVYSAMDMMEIPDQLLEELKQESENY
jgi:hypothetical protein